MLYNDKVFNANVLSQLFLKATKVYIKVLFKTNLPIDSCRSRRKKCADRICFTTLCGSFPETFGFGHIKFHADCEEAYGANQLVVQGIFMLIIN